MCTVDNCSVIKHRVIQFTLLSPAVPMQSSDVLYSNLDLVTFYSYISVLVQEGYQSYLALMPVEKIQRDLSMELTFRLVHVIYNCI